MSKTNNNNKSAKCLQFKLIEETIPVAFQSARWQSCERESESVIGEIYQWPLKATPSGYHTNLHECNLKRIFTVKSYN